MPLNRSFMFQWSINEMFELYELQMIHPKSDEQRQRLSESVRNILLFRALDKVRTKKKKSPPIFTDKSNISVGFRQQLKYMGTGLTDSVIKS